MSDVIETQTANKNQNPVVKGLIVPGQVQPLMVPHLNEGWGKLRKAFEEARTEIESSDADLLVIYSTKWLSVIGHQIQARPEPEWVQVDEEWHEYGEIPYKFRIDSEFAELYKQCCEERGLHARTINYHGFPIDTGSIVALKLLNPDNRLPAVIVSSNMYADRAETVVLGKACRDAVERSGRKAIAVISTALSNRYITEIIDPKDDRIHSQKDHEWNLKMLEFLEAGRLEDVAQLSRQIHREARVPKVTNFKPFWWFSAFMGAHNNYEGKVYEYQPLYGMGGAVVSLTPSDRGFGDLEYDEEDPEVYVGDRNVLTGEGAGKVPLRSEDDEGHED